LPGDLHGCPGDWHDARFPGTFCPSSGVVVRRVRRQPGNSLHLSPEQADEEFGPVRNWLTAGLFAFAGIAGLTMAWLFLFGSWHQPGSYRIAGVAGVVSIPCLIIAFRALTRPASPSLRVSPGALSTLAILLFAIGAVFLILTVVDQLPLQYGAEFVFQAWGFGYLAWRVARRRAARPTDAAQLQPRLRIPGRPSGDVDA
jgi:hypothetical protein